MGARDVFDPETGVKLPEKVVLYGSFQPFVGAVLNDSNSEITRMYYLGDGVYSLSLILPYKGTYDFAISTYGTMSATYCYDTYPRSDSSNKQSFTVEKENTILNVRFCYSNNKIELKQFQGERVIVDTD